MLREYTVRVCGYRDDSKQISIGTRYTQTYVNEWGIRRDYEGAEDLERQLKLAYMDVANAIRALDDVIEAIDQRRIFGEIVERSLDGSNHDHRPSVSDGH